MLHKPAPALPKHWVAESEVKLEAPYELIERTLGRGTGMVVGPSSAGKTALLIGITMALTTGQDWFGRRIRETVGVAIIAGEGVGGLKRRFAAARIEGEIDQDLPIAWMASPGGLLTEETLGSLIADLEAVHLYFMAHYGVPLRMVFIDTLSACFSMDDENAGGPGAKVISNMQRISDVTEGLTLAIHHPPKSGVGERGSGAFRGNSDFVLTASCNRNDQTGEVTDRRLAVTKNRDGEAGLIGGFKLKRVELALDNHWGDPVASIVAVPTDAVAMPQGEVQRRKEGDLKFDEAFTEMLLESGGSRHHPAGDGPPVNAVNIDLVREEFYRRYVSGEKGPRSKAATKQGWTRAKETAVVSRVYATENVGELGLIWRVKD